MRDCFVSGCDGLCKNNPKRQMFLAPKDEKIFEIWKSVLPKIREFQKYHKVCERHFNPDDIILKYETIIGGKIFSMDRGKPKLKSGAVPCLNLNVDNVKPSRRGRKPNSSKLCTYSEQIASKTNGKEISQQIDDKLDDCVENTIVENNQMENKNETDGSNVNNEQIQTLATKLLDTSETNVANEEYLIESDFFENLYDEIFEVIMPNTLWALHRDPNKKFIIFTYYNLNIFATQKTVLLYDVGIIKIFIYDKLYKIYNYIEHNSNIIDAITNILSEVDDITICKFFKNNSDCKLNCSKKTEYCSNCLQLFTELFPKQASEF